MSPELYFLSILILFLLYNSIWRVPPLHVGTLERLSKYVPKTYFPGIHIKIPFLDKSIIREALVETETINVKNVVPPEEYGELEFPLETAGRIYNLPKFLLRRDYKKEISSQFKQYLQDFVKDKMNPPKGWREALQLLSEKYLHWIVARVLRISFPKYENDGVAACDGKQKGTAGENDFIEEHEHSAEELTVMKKGVYKFRKCMTLGEKQGKDRVVDETTKLINGEGSLCLESVGFEITRLNSHTVIPSKDLQKLIDEQAEQVQEAKKEELALKVEEVQRNKEVYQTDTVIMQAQKLKDDMGISGKEAVFRVLQLNGHLKGLSQETVINSLGKEDNIAELIMKGLAIVKGAEK